MGVDHRGGARIERSCFLPAGKMAEVETDTADREVDVLLAETGLGRDGGEEVVERHGGTSESSRNRRERDPRIYMRCVIPDFRLFPFA